LANNKFYIGSSNNIRTRFYKHKSALKHNKHENRHLQRAYNKYGIKNFKFEVLEECLKEELLQKEQMWIDKLDCNNEDIGFNICKIAGIPSNQNGQNNSRAKITEDIAIHIKQDLSKGFTIKDIQNKYNVSYQIIVNIRNLLAWKNYTPELNEKILSFKLTRNRT